MAALTHYPHTAAKTALAPKYTTVYMLKKFKKISSYMLVR